MALLFRAGARSGLGPLAPTGSQIRRGNAGDETVKRIRTSQNLTIQVIIRLACCGTAMFAATTFPRFFDKPILDYVGNVNLNIPSLFIYLLFILGTPEPYIAVCGFILMFCSVAYINTGFYFAELKIPGRALLILFSATIGWLCADLFKVVLRRPCLPAAIEARSDLYIFHPLAFGPSNACFPSEHATIATAVGFGFSILMPVYRPTFFAIAAFVAANDFVSQRLSPSDIIGGVLVGLTVTNALDGIFSLFSIKLR